MLGVGGLERQAAGRRSRLRRGTRSAFQQSGQKLCTSPTIVPQPAQRGGSAKSSIQRPAGRSRSDRCHHHAVLSPASARRTSAADAASATCSTCELRALRRDRALSARAGAVPARARVRRLPRAARADPPPVPIGAADRLPGPGMARAAGRLVGLVETPIRDRCSLEPRRRDASSRIAGPPPRAYDLCLAIGTLDTVNDLPRALPAIRAALQRGLAVDRRDRRRRHACRSCAWRCTPPTRSMGAASPHVHPRIEAAGAGAAADGRGLRHAGGRRRPGAGVLCSRSDRLVATCGAMGATNILDRALAAAAAREPRVAAARQPSRSAGDGRGPSRRSKSSTSPPGRRRPEPCMDAEAR